MVENEQEKEKTAFEMMVLYIHRESKVNISQVRDVLKSQKKFFKEAVR